jgi:hypothetical protein
LFWAACRIGECVHPKLLPYADAEELLVRAGREVGLTDNEARKSARSGLDTALRERGLLP